MRQHTQVDPLYVIFEEHLFNFQDEEMDRKGLIQTIVGDYLNYLRRLNISVPKSLEQPVVEELSRTVNTMIVKKIYGCLNIDEYRSKVGGTVKKRATRRYSKLKKAA